MLAVIRQSHDGMQTRVRLDDGERSDKSGVGQGPRQGCVLAPLLFNIFYAVLHVAEKRFIADAAIMDKHGTAPTKKKEDDEGKTKTRKSRREEEEEEEEWE